MPVRRKTVLHVIDTGGPGGAETIFLNLVTGLDRTRWRSVAVVPARDWLSQTLQQNGVEPLYMPSWRSFDLKYLAGLATLAGENNVDLIHTHLFSSAVYGTIAA